MWPMSLLLHFDFSFISMRDSLSLSVCLPPCFSLSLSLSLSLSFYSLLFTEDDVGDCVFCQQFTETCVNYRMAPCTTELSHKCKLIINAKKNILPCARITKYRQVVENKLAVIKKSI